MGGQVENSNRRGVWVVSFFLPSRGYAEPESRALHRLSTVCHEGGDLPLDRRQVNLPCIDRNELDRYRDSLRWRGSPGVNPPAECEPPAGDFTSREDSDSFGTGGMDQGVVRTSG